MSTSSPPGSDTITRALNHTTTVQSNCSSKFCALRNCPKDVPDAGHYLAAISGDSTMVPVFTVFGILSGITVLIYLLEIYHLLKNEMPKIRLYRTIMLLSLYPVFSLLALFAVIVPRSAPLLDLVANVFFSLCLWQFMQLMILYSGGEKKICENFENTTISIQVFPICCLFFCLPKVKMTKSFLRTLKMGAVQFLVFRPLVMVVSMILWVEDKYEIVDDECGRLKPFQSPSTYISLINMGSTLLAMWPLIIIFRASIRTLAHYRIKGKFFVFQLVMIFGSLQDTVLTQAANFNIICCNQYLPTKSRTLEMHHLGLIAEMFILSVAALCVYWKFIRSPLYVDAPKMSDTSHEPIDPEGDKPTSSNHSATISVISNGASIEFDSQDGIPTFYSSHKRRLACKSSNLRAGEDSEVTGSREKPKKNKVKAQYDQLISSDLTCT